MVEYCCEAMQRSIERDEMIYDPICGSFQFYIKDEAWGGPGTFHCKVCNYCPYCGKRLHKDLTNELETVLEKEYGIMLCDVDLQNPSTLPAEFQTDEWWKKRGL